jgi:predicted MFS family arabinose efflux permease
MTLSRTRRYLKIARACLFGLLQSGNGIAAERRSIRALRQRQKLSSYRGKRADAYGSPAPQLRGNHMTSEEARRLAIGGLLAMAAALGIGRFVYTPILPSMIDALGWTKATAGVVASANFLGYLLGALVAGLPIFSSSPRRWLFVGLISSAVTTGATGLLSDDMAIMAARFVGGLASAFVIVCASTLVLARLSAAGRSPLASIHFAGVGVGIFVSAAIIAVMTTFDTGWRELWVVSGAVAALMAVVAATLVLPVHGEGSIPHSCETSPSKRAPIRMIAAYGLFGFGYVITATFLVTIVRRSPEIRPLEPWIWILLGLAAVPSVPFWQRLGQVVGPMRAYAVACVVEAIAVILSVDWVTTLGIGVAAVLLGGTFMGLTALGLTIGRALAAGRPQRVIGLMTASFGAGQMIGPTIAGYLAESTGSLRLPSWLAAGALLIAAALALLPPQEGVHFR